MPRLWTDTIEEHRRAVQDAAVDATAALVGEHGLASVTMSRIAAETGIGRATLYLIQHQHHNHGTELAALLHRGEYVTRAQHQLHAFISDLLAQDARSGEIRDDVAPGELASYCLHALTAASSLPTEAAARRLVSVTLAGLRRRTGSP